MKSQAKQQIRKSGKGCYPGVFDIAADNPCGKVKPARAPVKQNRVSCNDPFHAGKNNIGIRNKFDANRNIPFLGIFKDPVP